MALLKLNVVFAYLPQIALQTQARARHVQADPMERLALRSRRFSCRGSACTGIPAGGPAEKTVAEGFQGLGSEFVLPEEHRHGGDAGAQDPDVQFDTTARKGAKSQPQCRNPHFFGYGAGIMVGVTLLT